MNKIFVIVSAILTVLLSPQALADNGSELLGRLAQELKKVRTSTSDKVVAISPVPNVAPLIGLKREQVLSILGAPNSQGDEDIYIFVSLPPGWRGGGPELFLKYSDENIVEQAEWHFSR